MPEGPEIRLAADRIAAVLVGQPIVEVSFGLPDLARYERRLTGSTITAVDTRGKAMLTRFENGLTIYSHNQLYGRWYTTKRPKLPRTKRQLRVALHTATQSALLYSASDIAVLTEKQLARHPFLVRIGPDILDAGLDSESVARRLVAASFRNRALGGLYLDQAFLAGNGNYLRSEILHDAGLHHTRRPADLTRGEIGRLSRSTLTLSRRSYDTGGITLAPRLAKALERAGLKRGMRRFYAFGRAGRPCYHCSEEIRRQEIGGRRLYFCAQCQPR